VAGEDRNNGYPAYEVCTMSMALAFGGEWGSQLAGNEPVQQEEQARRSSFAASGDRNYDDLGVRERIGWHNRRWRDVTLIEWFAPQLTMEAPDREAGSLQAGQC
jgi:hypothetical protein